MTYDTQLEKRIDLLESKFETLTKKRMFGGIGYLLNGNMAFGIHKDFLVIRVSSDQSRELLKNTFISPFNLTGRPMSGWLLIAQTGFQTEKQLLKLLDLAYAYAKKLPSK